MDNENFVAVSFLILQLTYSLLASGGKGGGCPGGTCYMTPRTLSHLQQGKQNQDTVLVCCHLFLPGQILQQTNRSIFDKNLVFLFDWRYLHLHIFLKYHFKVSFYSCLQAGGGHLYDPSPGKLTFHFTFGGGVNFQSRYLYTGPCLLFGCVSRKVPGTKRLLRSRHQRCTCTNQRLCSGFA